MEDSLPQQKTQFVPRAPEGLTCAIALLFNRAGIAVGEVISCEGPRGLRSEVMFKQGRRCY